MDVFEIVGGDSFRRASSSLMSCRRSTRTASTMSVIREALRGMKIDGFHWAIQPRIGVRVIPSRAFCRSVKYARFVANRLVAIVIVIAGAQVSLTQSRSPGAYPISFGRSILPLPSLQTISPFSARHDVGCVELVGGCRSLRRVIVLRL